MATEMIEEGDGKQVRGVGRGKYEARWHKFDKGKEKNK